MLVAGAGGHALDLLDLLLNQKQTEDLCFFDNVNEQVLFENQYTILKSEKEVLEHFKQCPYFILGIGSPRHRKFFYDWFIHLGGQHFFIKGEGVVYSNFTENNEADIFNLCFVGAKTKIGKGVLINTGSQVHHEVVIGDFSEINPGAVILGKVKIGNFSSIGANATILPKIEIGDNVIIGAGAVVTKDVPDFSKVIGVPGRVVGKVNPII
ncbi:acetyltransferase [Lunatibacter salilacus]|uniref:acetyltransferase n=1 Tax=Lunatibacter salilacus TaxID=2483804 RepID=UPI00131B2767|nr:acetyltransferase [Lunatibacter salilacus]